VVVTREAAEGRSAPLYVREQKGSVA